MKYFIYILLKICIFAIQIQKEFEMIQSYIKGKLVIQDNCVKHNEDLKTSSSIGLLQYLSDDIFWKILYDSCVDLKKSDYDFGRIISINFWEHTDATNTTNNRLVEPDVWIETENYDVIIEAKVDDSSGQSKWQWDNEVKSIKNEQTNNNYFKKIVLIALGGNENMQQEKVFECPVYKVSWYNLTNAIVNERNIQKKGCFCRVLDDVIELFARQGLMKIQWFNTIPKYAVDNRALALWRVCEDKNSIGFSTIHAMNINNIIILQWNPIDYQRNN